METEAFTRWFDGYTGGKNLGSWRNLFVVKLSPEGRCREYVEWYFQDPDLAR